MKALLTVTCVEGSALGTTCLPLFPILDRPFLQHVVEALAARGIREIEFVVGPRADEIETVLGDGARWGCRFTWHLTRDPVRAARLLRAAAAGPDRVLIGRTDCLPLLPDAVGAEGPVLFKHDGEWTGWAVVDAADLRATPLTATWNEFGEHLATRGLPWADVGAVLPLRSLEDVAAAQHAALDRSFPGLLRAAREVRPGVWVARNTSISAAATLVAPVFIGEGTIIGAGAVVGPWAVGGAACLFDNGCEVRDTTVLPSSYVGPEVSVDGVIVDGGFLIHPVRGTEVRVESHLLDGLPTVGVAAKVMRLLGRAAAGAAFLLGLPVLAVAAAWLRLTRRGPVFSTRSFVNRAAARRSDTIPSATAYVLSVPRPDASDTGWVVPATLGGLLLEFLPGLLAVARGQLRLVGLPPRDVEQMRRLLVEKRPALIGAPMGLVTEAALSGSPGAPVDDVLMTDVYQVYTTTPLADVSRLTRFLLRAATTLRQPEPPAPAPVEDTLIEVQAMTATAAPMIQTFDAAPAADRLAGR